MKNVSILFIAFLLLPLNTFAQQGWFQQQCGTTCHFHGTYFVDLNNGVVVGDSGKILRTTDGGENWISQPSGTTEALRGVCFTDANNGTAVGTIGTILRTTDGGQNWISQTSGISQSYLLQAVSFIDEYNGIIVGNDWYGFSESIILRTTDGGENWISQTSGTIEWLRDVSFTDANYGTAVGFVGTILRTTNGGVSFIEENEINEIATNYYLSNNFPNPFNPSTKIRYSVPQSSSVIIKVFDVLGNEIETLVDEQKNTGTYEITWNAENLTNGVYFYRLQVYAPGRAGSASTSSGQSFVETKKMVLLR